MGGSPGQVSGPYCVEPVPRALKVYRDGRRWAIAAQIIVGISGVVALLEGAQPLVTDAARPPWASGSAHEARSCGRAHPK